MYLKIVFIINNYLNDIFNNNVVYFNYENKFWFCLCK